MEKQVLNNKLLLLLNKFVSENEIEISEEVNENSRLFGSSSIFDSLELVQFIVEVEEFIEDEFDIEIQLASEKAMSRRNSPFINLKSLANFALEEIKWKKLFWLLETERV